MANIPLSPREIEAWDFAKLKHDGQVRKFINKSYFDAHVQKVNGIAKQYTSNEDILIAAILHDVIEDCYDNKWIGYSEIKAKFGKNVADLVLELTSDNDEITYLYDGSKTNYLINKMVKMSDSALVIKLCDRLQNISDAFTASPKFRLKYFNETSAIVSNVENRRTLNKIHVQLLADIKAKLNNIDSIFKIEKFNNF